MVGQISLQGKRIKSTHFKVREWSLQDSSLLESSRTEALTVLFGSELRTNSFSWFQEQSHHQPLHVVPDEELEVGEVLPGDVVPRHVRVDGLHTVRHQPERY